METSQCGCSNQCNEKISPNQRKVIFENFYCLSSFDLQSAYLFEQISIIPKVKSYINNESIRRNLTQNYNLPNAEGKNIKICKQFLKTRPGNKTSDIKIKEIKLFINRFPVYESHYTRKKRKKIFGFLPKHQHLIQTLQGKCRITC